MRLLPLIFLMLAGSLVAGEPTPPYPLWDGQESVAEYAKKVGLPATNTLDLGGGVNMELVLIPAGKFVMGTPEPVAVDESGFQKKIVTGQVLLAVSGVALLVLLCTIIVAAVRKRQRPKYSLLWLLAITIAAGGCVLTGLHWRQAVKGLDKARVDYIATKARYDAASDNEKPGHPVMLTKPFYIGKFAVTQEQYQQVIGNNPSNFKGKDNPVEQVSWDDAQAFCKKLTKQTKQTVRLPSDAEWEYACRAGTTTTYHSGDAEADLARVAWYNANSNNLTHPVGQKEANAFGLYDMHGNVWQWCEDWWDENYYANSPAEDPQGSAHGARRVLRGGSAGVIPVGCRSAFRFRRAPVDRYLNFGIFGFRVVVVPASRTP
jgi:formylglycine-generating enzyme required for sulfatase activity